MRQAAGKQQQSGSADRDQSDADGSSGSEQLDGAQRAASGGELPVSPFDTAAAAAVQPPAAIGKPAVGAFHALLLKEAADAADIDVVDAVVDVLMAAVCLHPGSSDGCGGSGADGGGDCGGSSADGGGGGCAGSSGSRSNSSTPREWLMRVLCWR